MEWVYMLGGLVVGILLAPKTLFSSWQFDRLERLIREFKEEYSEIEREKVKHLFLSQPIKDRKVQ